MKKKEFLNIIFVFLIFIIGSFIGFLHENILIFLKGRYVLRQGLVYLPLIPIYGVGLLIFYFSYKNFDFDKKKIFRRIIMTFLIGFLVGGATEYLCSFLQEKIFGTISWDYHYLKYNLNGRTSLYHSFFWGMAGVLYYEFLRPLLLKVKKILKIKKFRIICIIISVIVLIDIIISTAACMRQMERRLNIPTHNKVGEILDKFYPDEKLNRVYNNARVPKKKKI